MKLNSKGSAKVSARITPQVLGALVIAATLLAFAAGEVGAEPGKNKIIVEGASCSDGVTRTLVVNAMGKAVKLPDSRSNFIVKSSTFVYSDPETGDYLATEEFGGGRQGGLQERLVTCKGETTTEIFGLGLVTIDYTVTGFFTPRSVT